MKNKGLYILSFLFFCIFIAGTFYNAFYSKEKFFSKELTYSENVLSDFQDDFEQVLQDSALLNQLIENDISKSNLNFLYDKPYEIYVYNSNNLTFWSSNAYALSFNKELLNTEGLFVEGKNGYFVGIKQSYKEHDIIALQLIKSKFEIVNAYLTNDFSPYYKLSDKAQIMAPFAKTGTPVKNKNGDTIFKLSDDTNATHYLNKIDIVGYLSLLFLMLFTLTIVRAVSKNYGFSPSLTLHFILSILFVLLVHFVPYTFKNTLLFSPEIYASQYLGHSLGILLMIIIALCTFFLYFSVYYFLKKISLNKIQFVCFSIILITLILCYGFLIKSLVINSIISFNVISLTLTNIYSAICIFILVLGGISLFLTISVWVNQLYNYFHKKSIFYIIPTLLLCFLIFILFKQDFKTTLVYSATLLALMLLNFALIHYDKYRKPLNYMMLYIITLSLLLSSLINIYNQQDENDKQAALAIKYSEKRDLLTEYKFGVVKSEIVEDPYVIKFFTSPFVSKKELYQRLDFLYFGGYLSKYNIETYEFNNEGKGIKTSDTLNIDFYKNKLSDAEQTGTENMYLLPKKNGKNVYISLLPIYVEGNKKGTLIIEFTPKTYTKENLYPELLIEENINLEARYEIKENYEYAVYNNNYLISQSGEFPFPYFLGTLLKDNENPKENVIVKDNYWLNIFQIDDNTKVVISSQKNSFLKQFSYFSYFFIIIILMALLAVLGLIALNFIFNFLPKKPLRFSLKNRIIITIFLITISSFFLIGIVTVSYFNESYKNDYTEDLIRKQKSVLSSIAYLNDQFNITSYNNIPSGFSNDIASLAKNQGIDVNIFSSQGKVLISSQPGIFSNGIISKYINPIAYFNLSTLNSERFIQEESIGKLKFQSIYVPIRDKEGNLLAFLNIPYFAQVKALKKDITDLTIALINLYIFLLIISIIITYLIANSVTSPLAKISEDLRQVSLSKKNKAIVWNNPNDEIGALVAEYNKMIKEIERSAKALAKSERETAWREMAKQIAHEIKNPLTPMKLSIQHLQRAIDSNDERVPELTKKVSNTIISQIDTLSDIATAFSNFAKMPTAHKNKINLTLKIQNVVNLFNEEDKQTIIFNPTIKEAFILADKNQIIGVFNNLVKNAMQATEDIDKPTIEITLSEEDEDYLVQVKDNGCGIANDKKNKVFVPNFTTKSSGTGLGLAISKQIIENNNGKIWFESTENVGTSFYVSIPKLS
ncbi:MAG: HAMP domain-containing histidine kinase [Chitinophagales bacterium]|nr:HAMP domain-containing histidine kinase [Chitinophagales bacterium]